MGIEFGEQFNTSVRSSALLKLSLAPEAQSTYSHECSVSMEFVFYSSKSFNFAVIVIIQ